MRIYEILSQRFPNHNIAGDNVHMSIPCVFAETKHTKGRDGGKHLYVNLNSGLWFCHICHSSGNWESLARILGITTKIELYQEEEELERYQDENVIEVLHENILLPYKGKCPKQLLESGFSMDLLDSHGIGFDENRMRIIFPIRNLKGELVGISGRSVVDEKPKYKFYTEEIKSAVPNYSFEKSKHLYRGNLIEKDKPIIITEGFKACLWMVQNEYKNTIAIMGSHLSDQQAKHLHSLSNEFVLFLDADSSGMSGMEKAYQKLSSCGITTFIIGDKKQPDDYNKEELDALIQNQKSFWEVKFN